MFSQQLSVSPRHLPGRAAGRGELLGTLWTVLAFTELPLSGRAGDRTGVYILKQGFRMDTLTSRDTFLCCWRHIVRPLDTSLNFGF